MPVPETRRPSARPSRRLAALALAAACACAACGTSAPGDALTGRYYAPGGVVLAGYDPVAYFEEGRPVKGRASFSHEHDGATFWFATAENRDRFAADPDRYTPQYGGFCAYGMSEGYRATTEPDAFTVHEGRLYLNYDREVRRLWSAEQARRIARADENWRKEER